MKRGVARVGARYGQRYGRPRRKVVGGRAGGGRERRGELAVVVKGQGEAAGAVHTGCCTT